MTRISLAAAQKFLRDLGRPVLAALLDGGSYELIGQDAADVFESAVELRLAQSHAEALTALSDRDRQRVAEALRATDANAAALGIAQHSLLIAADTTVVASANSLLIAELVIQRSVMIDIATNTVLIADADDYYRARRKRIRAALAEREIADPVPFETLRQWYEHYSHQFPTYKERRTYLYELFEETFQQLLDAPTLEPPTRPLTGWERVDRALVKARNKAREAHNEEDWQGIGLLCREALISLAQAVYDPARHPPTDGVIPSRTDAKRMLEAFIEAEAPGESNQAIRRHARASLSLAHDLVHARTADQRRALLALEATGSTTNVIAILSGRVSSMHLAG